LAEEIRAGGFDELVVDFVGIGLWWYADGAWSRIKTESPEGMVAVANALYVDYGGKDTGGAQK